MKRVTFLLVFFGAMFCAFDGAAQMDKKEMKVWKKRIKQLEPEQYKSLLDENKSLKGQMSSLKAELSGVDQTIADKDDQIEQLQSSVSDLRSELNNAKAELQVGKVQPSTQLNLGASPLVTKSMTRSVWFLKCRLVPLRAKTSANTRMQEATSARKRMKTGCKPMPLACLEIIGTQTPSKNT
jgi:gamma-glutamylcysteine synthetase